MNCCIYSFCSIPIYIGCYYIRPILCLRHFVLFIFFLFLRQSITNSNLNHSWGFSDRSLLIKKQFSHPHSFCQLCLFVLLNNNTTDFLSFSYNSTTTNNNNISWIWPCKSLKQKSIFNLKWFRLICLHVNDKFILGFDPNAGAYVWCAADSALPSWTRTSSAPGLLVRK